MLAGIPFATLWGDSADEQIDDIFSYFSQKIGFDISCKLRETLRKHVYSNILKNLPPPPKNESFQIKNSDIFFFHISA